MVNLVLGIYAFLAAILISLGGLTAFIAWRRGRNPVAWYLIGLVLGPIGLVLAVFSSPIATAGPGSSGGG